MGRTDWCLILLVLLLALVAWLAINESSKIANLLPPSPGTVLWQTDLPSGLGVFKIVAAPTKPGSGSVEVKLLPESASGVVGIGEQVAERVLNGKTVPCHCYVLAPDGKSVVRVNIQITDKLKLVDKKGKIRQYYWIARS